MNKIGVNDPCPCGALRDDGKPKKYKKCHGNSEKTAVPQEVIDYFRNLPREPFERGGFLTGRPFISTEFQGMRMRAMANRVYKRPLEETFHLFILREFFNTLTQEWVEKEEKKQLPHTIIQWSRETQNLISASDKSSNGEVRGIKLTGKMRSLLAIAYDFYTLEHCNALMPPKLLNRLRDENQFQGARYEIAVAGLVCRSGFEIKWNNDEGKHCEFIGTHKVTKDKAAFEAKSHHREGVLGRDGSFNPETARTKIMDHVREAIEQAPMEDIPLVVFDDLNLPLTAGVPLNEKKWFKEVEQNLEKHGFYTKKEYSRCGALMITNFSWHFNYDVPPEQNELVTHFNTGIGPYVLKIDTVLQYLDLAAKQYGFVPALQYEFEDKSSTKIKKSP